MKRVEVGAIDPSPSCMAQQQTIAVKGFGRSETETKKKFERKGGETPFVRCISLSRFRELGGVVEDRSDRLDTCLFLGEREQKDGDVIVSRETYVRWRRKRSVRRISDDAR